MTASDTAGRSPGVSLTDVVLSPTSAPRVTVLRSAPYIAVVIGFPLMLMLVNNSWVFIPPNGIDPWVYTGYFLDLRQLLNVFPDAYYGSRLPWVLLGAAVHAMTPSPEVAQYALRLILYLVSTLSLFVITYVLFQSYLSATLAALVLGADTAFLWAIGWDYVDGFGISLIFLTVACLTAAALRPSRRLWLTCAGFACASMVSTNLTLVLVTPFLLGGYLLIDQVCRRTTLAVRLGWFAFGAAGAIVVFGIIDWVLTGRFWFLAPQFQAALAIGGSTARSEWANYNWIPTANWLLFPVVSLVIACVLVGDYIYSTVDDGGSNEIHRRAALVALLLIGLEVFFLVLQVARFILALQVPYYASYLIPFASICIGAAIARSAARTSAKSEATIIASTAAGLLVPFAAPVHSWLVAILTGLHSSTLSDATVAGPLGWMAAISCLLLAVAIAWKRGWLTVTALVALGFLNVSAANTEIITFPPSPAGHSRNLMAFDVIRAAKPFNQDGKLMFWYDVNEPLGGLFRAVSSAHLWARRLISEEFPGRTAPLTGTAVTLGSGETVAILSSRSDVLERAEESLSQIGADAQAIGFADVQRANDRLTMNFVRVLPRNAKPAWEIPLNTLRSAPTGSLSPAPSGEVIVHTTAAPWAYAAILAIPSAKREVSEGCRALVRVRVRVQGGPIGLGILNELRDQFVVRLSVLETTTGKDVSLQVQRLGDADDFIVQTWDKSSVAAVALSSVTVQPYDCPSAAK